jgi:hypothetical protein
MADNNRRPVKNHDLWEDMIKELNIWNTVWHIPKRLNALKEGAALPAVKDWSDPSGVSRIKRAQVNRRHARDVCTRVFPRKEIA